ncbi:hypothetical protein PITCH_A1580032 [uncultured Desulfobacterium sp.]|uniref:Uncharacterized protein n=1 Tax=uncultured Desulfobacterium sp. TaxID=201089 RepID=A0A445MTQ8_9BACT|nr:hypothetical protein PITCH_A1580032 [uncultured Desulfobacterium sp.]
MILVHCLESWLSIFLVVNKAKRVPLFAEPRGYHTANKIIGKAIEITRYFQNQFFTFKLVLA